MMWKSASSSG